MGVKERYQERHGVKGRYLQKYYGGLDVDRVDQAYIDSFVNDANTFLSTAERDYGGVTYGTAADTYNSRNTAWQDLDTRANTIEGWLVKNRSNIGTDAYKSLSESLASYRSGGKSILDSFKGAADFYTQFESEDAYNKYTSYQQLASSAEGEQGWQKYLADTDAKKNALKHDLNGDGKEAWWEKAIGYLGGSGGGAVDTALPTAGITQTIQDLRSDDSYARPQDDWSEDQRRIFGALYMSSPQEAYQYATAANNQNKRIAEEEKLKKISDSATSGFWSGLGHTLGAIATAPLGMADFLNDLAMANAGRDITPDGHVSPFEYSQAVTEGISSHLNEKYGTITEGVPVLGGKGVGDLYALGTSIAQSMASAYTLGSGGTLVSYFGQGAASGVDEALSRGASEGQAILYGTSLGVFEGLAEMIGVDNLFKLGSSATVKGFIRNILNQAGAEGAEEGLTSLFSNIADNAILQNKSNFNFLAAQYMAEGMSEADAKKKAWLDTVGGIAFDTISGAVSGGVSGGIHTSIATASQNKKATQYGQSIINEGGQESIDALKQLALEMYDGKKGLEASTGKTLVNRVAKKASAKNVGNLTFELESAISKQNKSDFEAALVKKGLSKKEASLAAKYIAGEEDLSSDQIHKIENDEHISTAVNELLADPSFEINDNSAKLSDVLRKKSPSPATQEATEGAQAVSATENPTKKEKATAAKFSASADGVTRLGDEEVSIDRIELVKNGEVTLRLADGSTVNARDLTFSSEAEALLYENVVNMGLNTVSAQSFLENYDPRMSLSDYVLGFSEAYKVGELGAPKSELSTGLAARLTEKQKRLAYSLGKIDAKYKNKTNKESVKNEQEGIRVRDGSERSRGENTGGQVSAMESGARQDQSGKTNIKSHDGGATSLTHDNAVSAKSLGIKGGLDIGKARRIPDGSETTEMSKARKRAEARGLKVTFFAGDNLYVSADGETVSARGYIQGDEVFIRVDHPYYTADQLMRHEIGHDMIARGEIDVNDVRERIKARFGEENVKHIADAYAEAYEGSDMNADEIWEEIICDSLGDMNIFASVELLGEMNSEFLTELKEEVKKDAKSERGPPANKGKASHETAPKNIKYTLNDSNVDNSTAERYNDIYTATTDFTKKVSYEDREWFSRSLANKTSDMKDGERRSFVIYGSTRSNTTRLYWFDADGYMHGRITCVEFVENELEFKRKEFKNGLNRNSKIANLWNDSISVIGGKSESNIPLDEIGGEANTYDTVSADSSIGNRATDTERSKPNYQKDATEASEILRKLKELYDESDDQRYALDIRFSRELDIGKARRIPNDSETTEMSRARKRAEARGLKVTFFAGDNLYMSVDGKTVSARGYIEGDEVFIRVDHPYYTADQLMRHEIGHDMIARGEVDVNDIRERIKARFGEENVAMIANAYAEAYEGSDMNADEIWEEIVCDSLGDMNIFASVELLGEMNSEFLAKLKEEVKKDAKSERGPPINVNRASRELGKFDVKKSLRESVEEREASWYNEIKLDSREQQAIQSEALIWDAKYRNVLRTRTLSNGISYSYVIDNDGIVHVYGRKIANNIHEKGVKYDNGDRDKPDTIVKKLRFGQEYDDIDQHPVRDGRESTKDDSNDLSSIRAEGRGNGARNSNDGSVSNRRTEARVQESYLPIIYTFTDVAGRTRNVLKVGNEYMIEGNDRAKYSPTIELAVEAENVRVIKRYANKYNHSPTWVKNMLANDPDFLKKEQRHGKRFSRELDIENMETTSASKPKLSNRAILANALMSATQEPAERENLVKYQANIAKIDALEEHLAEVNAEIKALSFTKGADRSRLSALYEEKTKTANRITTYDRILLNLEANEALKKLLTREKQKAYKKAAQEGREAISSYRNQRNKTELRHKLKKLINELNQYLLNGTKDKHVPIELQKPVAEALDAVNMDTVGAEERIAEKRIEMMSASTPEAVERLAKEIEHLQEMGGSMADKLARLKAGYTAILDSPDSIIANSYDEVISSTIGKVIEIVGNTPLRDMSLYQLEAVYDMYTMVLHSIRNANKAFKAAKSEDISIMADKVMREIGQYGQKKPYAVMSAQMLSKFDWNNLKPVYAFERIGSATFSELFKNVRAGEDTWATDITEAKAFSIEQRKKYGYDAWDFKKRHTFTSTSGMTFELSLDQIMSLYAYAKRKQAKDHLKKGGIVIDETTEITVKNKLGIPVKFNPTQATAYNLSDEVLADIVSRLTEDQRGFVDAMQDYLSTTMGEKGNEVSLALYGIKLYKEKHYFPLKSATQFMAKAKEQQKGEVKIKNSGFSKETVSKASNPIVLTPFMDVWADHVNEMSMYHAFVLPLEDFYRVYNYKTPTSDTTATQSVEMRLQNTYGKAATQYIDQLLKDLNGGARVDTTTGFINKMTGLFKKSAVFASASVVIQQPSAIARATALVDARYFVGKPSKSKHKETWAEVKKYAPVAIIKEMGYFDTGMGRSTVEWIKGEKTWRDKIDDAASKAPALADELAWCAIWKAIKRETLHTHKDLRPNSEEFLKAVGERFTEVIIKTQVYDSVLARSANMRSKDTGMKMATAFMGEPTTSINMIENALIQGKRGNKSYARKAIGAVAASMILNSILVSIVYAGRDDDEEKTYAEKYVGMLTAELLDSFNPLTLVPFVKDIVSIVQGYDVERSDMAIVTDIINAWNNLDSDNRTIYRKVEDFAGAIASILGLPVKNIMRDARGMYNTVNSFIQGEKTTGAGIVNAVRESVMGDAKSTAQQLYEAMLDGDSKQVARIERRFDNSSEISSAIRKGLRDNDPRIKQGAEAHRSMKYDEYERIIDAIVAAGKFERDDVIAAVRAEIKAAEEDTPNANAGTEDKEVSYYTSGNVNTALEKGEYKLAKRAIDDIIEAKVKNGATEKNAKASLRSSLTSYWKPRYKEAYQKKDEEEMKRIRYILYNSGLYGKANDVVKTVQSWRKD